MWSSILSIHSLFFALISFIFSSGWQKFLIILGSDLIDFSNFNVVRIIILRVLLFCIFLYIKIRKIRSDSWFSPIQRNNFLFFFLFVFTASRIQGAVHNSCKYFRKGLKYCRVGLWHYIVLCGGHSLLAV